MAPRGFTLIELLVALALAGILLGLAVPAFRELVAARRTAADMNQIAGAIAAARAEAILRRRTVTFCPGAAGRCGPADTWHAGQLVFVDVDADGRLDDEDTLTHALPPLRPGARVRWRAFRARSYLQFQPRGWTRWQNGSFQYCPPDGDPRGARMAIVNAQGRVRMARDGDGDGVVENASGRPLACP
ncbi:MAG: hypothetical protein CMD39_05785 [Gammaproteobacteria bacterium]|nr:hypothetical protein [Gammaproteobacteria bacterium]